MLLDTIKYPSKKKKKKIFSLSVTNYVLIQILLAKDRLNETKQLYKPTF